MSQKKLLSVVLALVLTFAACIAAASAEPLKVEYTEAFSVEYLDDGVKLVTDAESQQFLLVPRGQTAPEGYDEATVIAIPVENALFASTTQVGMLLPYEGGFAGIKGVCQEPDSWPFEEIEAGLADGSITYVGNSYSPDYEAIQEMNPEISFVYTGSSGQTDLIAKLEELNLPYAVDNEYMEGTPEGRMEWTKFLAVFFGFDEQAVEYVDSQLERIAEMQETIKDAHKPKVAWGMVYDGTVYAPGGESYVAKQIDMAGGDYIFKDVIGTGSSQISIEEFYDKLIEADIWIYSSNVNYVPDYTALEDLAPVVMDSQVVKDKNVWQFGVNYYFNTANADIQIIDLAAIFHPDLYPDYEVMEYNRLAE